MLNASRKSALTSAFASSNGMPVASAIRSMALNVAATPAASTNPSSPTAAIRVPDSAIALWGSNHHGSLGGAKKGGTHRRVFRDTVARCALNGDTGSPLILYRLLATHNE